MTDRSPATPAVPSRGRLRPLGLDEVQITGGFWGRRQQINADVSLAHIEHWLDKTGWAGNFDLAAAGTLPEGRTGREFSDSEIYKTLEAMAWEIGRTDDAGLETRFRSLVRRVAAAQEPDGYVNTQFGRPGQAARWSDLEWGHELYCIGHLIQAGVARARTRPGADDGLLEVSCRAADLVCQTFGPDGVVGLCGHPVIEVALAELARVTGERRYLEQASLFIDRRGHQLLADVEWGRSYYQDDQPIRAATIFRGHTVRANYLAAGAIDVAVEQDDPELLDIVSQQWTATVARRTYITGGQGSQHQDEGLGEDWALTPDRAYSETCAAVASVMVSWRLLLAEGHSRHADLIERTLFNVIATSPSWAGDAFYYSNTLHQRRPGSVPPKDEVCPRAASSLRAPWFAVSCCPTNVARTLASLAAYTATVDDDGVQLHQYAPASIRTRLSDGRVVALDTTTGYPSNGVVTVEVAEDAGAPYTLSLRVPAWAAEATLVDQPRDGASVMSLVGPGTVTVTRDFKVGDRVELTLPMAPRLVEPDPRIDAVRGCVAVERGPEVLCLESTDLDLDAGSLSDLRIDPAVAPRDVEGRVVVQLLVADDEPTDWPYSADGPHAPRDVLAIEATLIPYHDWANRGPSTMRVWLPT
ncbi:glycoside hydrolase family 127 protein [Acidothermaceae bacterium B102]|nr:glycoside hydrolase family 127 protein [Acidothermaceae bacterium B102]